MIPFLKTLIQNVNLISAKIYHFFVCFVFIAKYSFNKLNFCFVLQCIVAILLMLFVCYIAYLLQKFQQKIHHKYLFYFTLILAVFAMTALTNAVNWNTLNVDRWSAFDVAIKSVLNQQYPYDKIDHLGGRTSNFPGLILLGIPVFLLHNIGLFTAFSVVIFGASILKTNSSEKALLILLLLFGSISFWWESYVVSDLMANFLLVASFLLLTPPDLTRLKFAPLLGISVLAAILAYTRIPAAMLIGTYFAQQILELRNKTELPFKTRIYNLLISLTVLVATIAVLTYWVFSLAPNRQTIETYHPFSLQSSYLPLSVNILCGLLPFILLFLVKKGKLQLIKIGSISLAVPVFLSFSYTLREYGWNACIYDSKFDISYFNMALPFVIVLIASSLPNTPRSEPQPHPTAE